MSKFIANSFQLPNAFVDELLEHISGNACKIYLLIVRKTRGWHKESDRISYSQIQKATGIGSSATVDKSISELVNLNLITYTQGDQKSANEYRLNDAFCTDEPTSKNEAQKNCSTSKNEVATSKNEAQKNCSTSKNEVATSKNEAQGTSKNEDTEIHNIKNTNQKYNESDYAHTHESEHCQNPQTAPPPQAPPLATAQASPPMPKQSSARPKLSYQPPEGLTPTDKQRARCQQLGVSADDELEKFLDWALANAKGYVDWSRGFSTWVGNIGQFGRASQTPRQPNRKDELRDPAVQAKWANFYQFDTPDTPENLKELTHEAS